MILRTGTKKFYKMKDEPSGRKVWINNSKVLRILSEEEALNLRARPGVSIAVVIVFTMLVNKKVKVTTITERNRKDTHSDNPVKTKFPSGGLEYGEHPFAAAKRELRTETGWETDDFVLAWAAEYSTTVVGETHYKLFVIAKNAKKVGEPIFDGSDEILSVDWRDFETIEEHIVMGQRIGLQPVIEKLCTIDRDYALDLMNMKARMRAMEGTYESKKHEK